MSTLKTSQPIEYRDSFDWDTMNNKKNQTKDVNLSDINLPEYMPDPVKVAQELGKATNVNDFWGKDGIFARMFGKTMETMMQAEMSQHLGYDKHASMGRGSGNNRNGSYQRKFKSSGGTTTIEVPRDRNGTFKSNLMHKYETSSNEIEDKITAMYGKGMTTRDIQSLVADMYGVNVSASMISQITDKVMPLVEEWQSRPLEAIYPVVFLDCIHVKAKLEGKINNIAVYVIYGVTLKGMREVLGHWVGTGSEGASYWLEVVTDLQNRGVQDILIASIDGLKGFSEAIQSVFPKTKIQRCIIHQIRNSMKYVAWKDRKEFVADLKLIYKAATKEEAEMNLLKLAEKWGKKYAIAVKSWENNWDELSTYFDYTKEIRRIIYTTNTIESYNRQIRKVIKTRSVFPTERSIRKLFYLANCDIVRKWTKPMSNWANILNQLVIKFEDRLAI